MKVATKWYQSFGGTLKIIQKMLLLLLLLQWSNMVRGSDHDWNADRRIVWLQNPWTQPPTGDAYWNQLSSLVKASILQWKFPGYQRFKVRWWKSLSNEVSGIHILTKNYALEIQPNFSTPSLWKLAVVQLAPVCQRLCWRKLLQAESFRYSNHIWYKGRGPWEDAGCCNLFALPLLEAFWHPPWNKRLPQRQNHSHNIQWRTNRNIKLPRRQKKTSAKMHQ